MNAEDIAHILMERSNGNRANVIYSEADEDDIVSLYLSVANLVPEVKATRKISVEDLEKVADILDEMNQEVDDFVKSIPEEMRGGTLWAAPRLEDR